MAGRGGRRWIQHDPGETLTGSQVFEKTPTLATHGIMPCRVDSAIFIEGQVRLETRQIRGRQVDRRHSFGAGSQQRHTECSGMCEEVQPGSTPRRGLREARTILSLIDEESIAGPDTPRRMPARVDTKEQAAFENADPGLVPGTLGSREVLDPARNPAHTIETG